MKRVSFINLLFSSLILSSCALSPKNVPSSNSSTHSMNNISFDNHLNISIGFWNIDEMKNNSADDALLNYIEDKFNITIEPISVNWSDYEDRYNIMATANTLPDIFATNLSFTQNSHYTLSNMITTHKIRALPNNLEAFPNISSVISATYNTLLDSDQNIYTIPRISFVDSKLSSSDAGMLVRKDWMENLNLSDPENIDEFIAMVSRFATEDPDGNGLDDTIGYNVNNRLALGKWLILGIAPQCNVYTWINSGKGFIPSYITPEFNEVITTYRTLYETGGLDPNFYIKKSNDAVNDFVHGKLGALEYKSSPSALTEVLSQWNEFNTDKKFEDCVKLLSIFPANNNNYYSNTSSLFWSESIISARVDDEKMTRILYLYEYLLSQEGWNLTRLGLEGIDYTINNGNYECLIEDTNDPLQNILLTKYPSLKLFANLASWGGSWNDFQLNNFNYKRYGEYITRLVNKELQWNLENTIPVERPYDFLTLASENTTHFTSANIIDDLTKVIIGTDPPLIMWQNILDDYSDNGLDSYIKEINIQANTLGIH